MSIDFTSFSPSLAFQWVTKSSSILVDGITELAFDILDTGAASLGRLLPDLRPRSVGETLLQIKQTGSALFETPVGYYLIEINRDGVFRSVGESLEPLIISEEKTKGGGILWEVKVSSYLQKIIPCSTRVDYGVSAARWRGDTFSALKEAFSVEGLLRQKGDRVFLKLPEEPLLTFKGPHASQKAEMVLKHFYQGRKTPLEEADARPWDLLNRLMVGYLYVSGHLLAPWVHGHVSFSPHGDRARQMVAGGYLDGNELREMAQNTPLRHCVIDMASHEGSEALVSQLDHVTFQQSGYTQFYEYGERRYEETHLFSPDKETHSRTVCRERGLCEESIREQTGDTLIFTRKKHGGATISVERATFKRMGGDWSLVDEERYEEDRLFRIAKRSFPSMMIAHAATAYLVTALAGVNPKLSLISSLFSFLSRVEGADAFARRRTAPITLLNPLPNFAIEPGSPFSYNINLASLIQLSNPGQNVELSISQANGQPAPGWISISMGPTPLITNLYLGNVTNSVTIGNFFVSGKYLYAEASVYNDITNKGYDSVQIIDISNPANPVFVTSVTLPQNSAGIYGQGNYIYIPIPQVLANSIVLQILNISVPQNPVFELPKTLNFVSNNLVMNLVGNNIITLTNTLYSTNFTVISISNPTNPQQVGLLTIPSSPSNPYSFVFSFGNYAFIGNSSGSAIINVSVPAHPVLVATVPNLVFDSACAKGNYLIIGTYQGIEIFDIATISSPTLVQELYIGVTVGRVLWEGDYVYASCGDSGFAIIDVRDILNPRLISSFLTFGSAYTSLLINNNIFLGDGSLSIYNAASRILSGTPGGTDRGLLLLNVTAQDDLGDTVVDQIAIHVGDIAVQAIPNQQVPVGNSTLFSLSPSTFTYPNAAFTYTAELAGGLPLPAFINFDAETLTFLFTPRSGDQNSYPIEVTGSDGYGGVASTTFDLIVPDRIPVLAQPLANQTAYSGEFFEYVVAPSSFTDGDGDALTYTAQLVGSNALPDWLSFDPALCRFYGTPMGRNSYQIQINANDGFGGTVSGIFTITVPSSAPVLLNPPGTQLVTAGVPFSFTFNSNTFYDLDRDPLTYMAGSLPSFLSFNNATRTFTGTPQNGDIGIYTISVSASNPEGATVSTTFSLSVISSKNDLPPVLVIPIPSITVSSAIPFNYTFNPGTFQDPQQQTLTYAATLEGGAPLPGGLYFDSNSFTLSGLIATPQTFEITITASDPFGAFAVDSFTLTAVGSAAGSPPILLNPLPDQTATVDAEFTMKVPNTTFKELNGDQLSVMATGSGGTPLPGWLRWNAATQTFSGKPGPFDTNAFSAQEHTIEVWATDSVGSVKTTFTLSVVGMSFWAVFIKYGFSVLTAGGLTLGLWRSRALIWNLRYKEKYQKGLERAFVGQAFSRKIKLDPLQLKEVRAYSDGHVLDQERLLPHGLVYKAGLLTGTPSGKDTGRFIIHVKDHVGYIDEEFELIIKNNESEPDPEVEKRETFVSKQYARLPSLSIRKFLKRSDPEDNLTNV